MNTIFNQEWIDKQMDTLSSVVHEERLVGALLGKSNRETFVKAYASVCDTVSVDHFSNKFLAEIYKAIGEIASSDDFASPFRVCKHLGLDPLSDSGKYIANIDTRGWLKPSAFSVYDLAKKRKLFEFMQEKLDVITEEDSEKMFKEFKSFFENSDILSETAKFLSGNEVLEQISSDLSGEKMRYSSGIKQLDCAMGGGFYPGKCYTFAARKKMGKTILAGTLASNLVDNGIKTLFMAGEMSPKEIHQRIVARKINRNSICFLEKTTDHLAGAVLDYKKQDLKDLMFLPCPGIPFEELRRKLYTAVNRMGIKVFILDYIQLVTGQKRGDSFASHMDAVAQWLADFCRKENVVGIVIAQLNQENGNIRGGEGIRLAADQVYQLEKSKDENYYLSMMDSRYTKYADIGTEDVGGLVMDMHGPHFRE